MAFINEHHEVFTAALARGISREQIADMIQGYETTVSPTRMRHYLSRKGILTGMELGTSLQTTEFEFASIERLTRVTIAAMSILEATE